MKHSAFFPFLLALAAITPGYGQTGAQPSGAPADDMGTISQIRRPSSMTATPPPSAAAAGKPLEAHLAADDKGKNPATAFAASTATIYLPFSDGTAAKGEKLRAVWMVDDAGPKITKHHKMYEHTQTLPGPVAGSFSLAAEGKLSPGKYHVDLYEGDKLAKTLPFTVTK
jgi:hypothetical protein